MVDRRPIVVSGGEIGGLAAADRVVDGSGAPLGSVDTLAFGFDFSTTTTMADPGSGTFRLDNATQGSATAIAISSTTKSSRDVSDIIAALGSGSKLYLVQWDDGARYHVLNVTGAPTDNGTWLQIPVSSDVAGTDLQDSAACRVLPQGGGGGGSSTVTRTATVVVTSPHAVRDPAGSVYLFENAGEVTEILAASPVATDAAGGSYTFEVKVGPLGGTLTSVGTVSIAQGNLEGSTTPGSPVAYSAGDAMVVEETAVGAYPASTPTYHERISVMARVTET